MNKERFEEFMQQILENKSGGIVMKYLEMTIEQAMKVCNKNDKVLVAVQSLENDDCDVIFVKKRKGEYESIFDDVKTVASACDDLVKQLRLFTEKQNIYSIEPHGLQKIILLNELKE